MKYPSSRKTKMYGNVACNVHKKSIFKNKNMSEASISYKMISKHGRMSNCSKM